MEAKGITDKDLEQLLGRVQLAHLLEREEDGWNTISDWMDVLSGGEKQRVAVRLLLPLKRISISRYKCLNMYQVIKRFEMLVS